MKPMRYSVIIVFWCGINMAQTPTSSRPNKPQGSHAHQCREQEPSDAQVVLGNFTSMLVSFGTIVKEPHNPVAVAPGIIGMLSGMVNIIAHIMRNMPIDRSGPVTAADIIEYLSQQDPYFEQKLQQIVVQAAISLPQAAVEEEA